MKLYLEWGRPIPLQDGSEENLIYLPDPDKLPRSAGVYVFGRRRRNGDFEALYVGKASDICGRVWSHRNNLPLMMHLRNAKYGKRVVRAGIFKPRPGQKVAKSLRLIERALIRYFLSEGHDLVNKQGTRLRRHEIASDGRHPNLFIPKLMFVDRAKGE
jgi:hypothetical protein